MAALDQGESKVRTPWSVVRDWFAFHCPDDAGRVQRTRFPHWRRMAAAGLPRPVRLHGRILGWWGVLYFVAPIILPMGLQVVFMLWINGTMKSWMASAAANPGLRPPTSPLTATLGVMVIMGALVLVLVVLSPTMNRSVARRHRAELLRLRRCPGCLYDLSGAPPPLGEDSLTTCAECGSAWQMASD